MAVVSSTAPAEQYFEDDVFTRTYYNSNPPNGVINDQTGVINDHSPQNATEHVNSNEHDTAPLIQDREISIRTENRLDHVSDFNKRLKRSAIGLSILSVILIGVLIFCIVAIVKLKTANNELERKCHLNHTDVYIT